MSGDEFRMGLEVDGTDGTCGKLVRLIVDPVKQELTHLVVAPGQHRGLGRLVPIARVDAVEDDRVRLSITKAAFDELDEAEEAQYLPADADEFGYGSHAMMLPYFAIGMPLGGHGGSPIYSDRVPAGEVEVNRGDQVHASDGWIGSVRGLVIDPADHQVTHVLLEEGHLWDKKRVALPVGSVTRVGEEIRVNLTKDQVAELPPIELS
jgi:sporulation protein YlmC with PRC-barrel domain